MFRLYLSGMATSAPERLRAAMKLAGVRPHELAQRLGCSKSFVSLMLNGRRLPSLARAADIERLSVDWPEGPIRATEWVSEAPATDPASREVRPAIRQAREWLAALDRLFVEAEEKGVAPVRLASVDGSAR